VTRHTEKCIPTTPKLKEKIYPVLEDVYLTSLQPSCCAANATQTPSRHDSHP